MRRLLLPLIILLPACGAVGVSAGDTRVVDRAEATVEGWDSAGTRWTRTVSHRYLLARAWPWGGEPERLVIHEQFTQLCCFEAEREATGEFALEAWSQDGGREPLWRAAVTADAAELDDAFYRTVRYGCCDSSDALEYFHVRSGGPVFSATARRTPEGRVLPSMEAPNSPFRRHAAFLDRFTSLDVPGAGGDDTVVGVLQYGPPEGPAARYLVRAPRNGADWRLVDIAFVLEGRDAGPDDVRGAHLDLWAADGARDAAALSGFAVRLELYGFEADRLQRLLIPVRQDNIVEGSLSDGFTVTRAGNP